MDHLKLHGCPPIPVRYVLANSEEKDVRKLLLEPEFSFAEFRAFPEEKNWTLLENGTLLKKTPGRSDCYDNKPRILQAWLYFALITCVVRTEKSLFHFGDLVASDNESTYLTTGSLPQKLQVWHDWMKGNLPEGQLHTRLLEADQALQLARKVIRANCLDPAPVAEQDTAVTVKAPTPHGLLPGPDGTSAYSSGPDAGDQDQLWLCLMALGETLTAVKVHIIEDLGMSMNDWLTYEDEGWGPPSHVLKEMKQKKWCPRTQKVLLGQLGPSAILLSAALHANGKQAKGEQPKGEQPKGEQPKAEQPKAEPEKIEQAHGEQAHKENSSADPHQACTADECLQLPPSCRSSHEKVIYPPQHHVKMCEGQCSLIGPDMARVAEILLASDSTSEAYKFPIFRIITSTSSAGNRKTDQISGITVEKWVWEDIRKHRTPNFATISHIWSQGMGNESDNKLYACQLKLIRTALEEANISNGQWDKEEFSNQQIKAARRDQPILGSGASHSLSEPFWMDTLAIPVSRRDETTQKIFREIKRRAIRQIYPVFNSATCTIVVDKDLCRAPCDSAIIQILTSAWMRRMWTLQEAFLSRRLKFAFQEPVDQRLILKDLDELIAGVGNARHPDSVALRLSLTELFKRKLYQNLMGEDREIRNRNGHPIEARGSMVIASAWRSSRWRSTSRLEDEVLSLSTLLNLGYRGTIIEKASDIAKDKNEDERRYERDNMMREFLNLVHRSYEGSIPAGLIFLPGKRLSTPAFGWAPRTWLCSQDEDYPYPLTMPGKATELHKEGLLVQYPGILIHGIPNRDVLRRCAMGLVFPTDRYRTEWYKAVNTHDGKSQQQPDQTMQPTETYSLGIILSRARPREEPPEIGLLVEIYDELWRRKEPQRIKRKIYCCQIVRRVLVSRTLTGSPAAAQPRPGGAVQDIDARKAIGEMMPDDTLWLVDGQRGDGAVADLQEQAGYSCKSDDKGLGNGSASIDVGSSSTGEIMPAGPDKPPDNMGNVPWYGNWQSFWSRQSQPK